MKILKRKIKEDAPVNVVGTGAIAGSGGKGGEPGVLPQNVLLFKKRKVKKNLPKSPVLMGFRRRVPRG